jgi:hypothetical protein
MTELGRAMRKPRDGDARMGGTSSMVAASQRRVPRKRLHSGEQVSRGRALSVALEPLAVF